MRFHTHQQLLKQYLRDPEFKRAYDELGPEFEVKRLMIEKRLKKGLTQAKLAKKLGTKQSAVSRFEAGRYNPSLQFLYKMARALDAELIVTVRSA